MKKKSYKKKVDGEGNNLWQPATDLMTGLVFVLIMLLILLGLYFTYEPDTKSVSLESESSAESGTTVAETTVEQETRGGQETEENEGGGGGEEDDEEKSAVLIVLVDAETGNVIQIGDVYFNLYEKSGTLQILNTYYPEKISYKNFATTEDGTFYLPEKIYDGTYFLRQISDVEGYGWAEDQYFEIEEYHDWSDPYVVKVPLDAEKGIIQVQLTDQDSGTEVGNGSFDIYADGDVVTGDGTVRYTDGEKVGSIDCDADGYGKSDALYLGSYSLKQTQYPEYYAGVKEDLSVTLDQEGEASEPVQISLEKTEIFLNLSDELYTTTGLEGAAFEVEHGDVTEEVYTDGNGNITLSDIEKNTTYSIRQLTALENYLTDEETFSFVVSADGRIEGEAQKTLQLTNRMLRVSIAAIDYISRNNVSNLTLSLYNSSGILVDTWKTGSAPKSFYTLAEGDYYVVRGDGEKQFAFTVENTVDIQIWKVPVFTFMSVLMIIGAVFVAILLITFIVVLIHLFRTRKKRRRSGD